MLTVFSVLFQVLLVLGVLFVLASGPILRLLHKCKYNHLAEKILDFLGFLIWFGLIIVISLLTLIWR